jgi:hypothetical protein
LFRIYLGCYLLVIFLFSFSSAADTWSKEGIVPRAESNLTYGIFPNLLAWYDSPGQVKTFLIVLSALSVLLITGAGRRWSALLLWYGWACLLNRNNLIINPSIHYTGWLLLACVLIPQGEPWALTRKNNEWKMPPLVFNGAWLIFAFGYFASGIDKLFSPSWLDGTAIEKILDSPLAFRFSQSTAHMMPAAVLNGINWLVIAAEMACLPLAIFSKTRKWAWLSVTLLQACILFTLNIPVIVFGMLSIHLFVIDHGWFVNKKRKVTSITG